MTKGCTYLEDEAMFDVEQDLAAVAVVLDENMQRVCAVDPTEQSGVGRKRDDWVLDDREVALERLRVLLKQGVDEAEELHDSLVLTKILVSCSERRVSCSLRTRSERADP